MLYLFHTRNVCDKELKAMGSILVNKQQKTKLPGFALVDFGELGFLFSPAEFALVKSISGIFGGRSFKAFLCPPELVGGLSS